MRPFGHNCLGGAGLVEVEQVAHAEHAGRIGEHRNVIGLALADDRAPLAFPCKLKQLVEGLRIVDDVRVGANEVGAPRARERRSDVAGGKNSRAAIVLREVGNELGIAAVRVSGREEQHLKGLLVLELDRIERGFGVVSLVGAFYKDAYRRSIGFHLGRHEVSQTPAHAIVKPERIERAAFEHLVEECREKLGKADAVVVVGHLRRREQKRHGPRDALTPELHQRPALLPCGERVFHHVEVEKELLGAI